ncbi:hypothetical protein V5799_006850 [Amblyomma americanum]|uniref:Coiled-coil domain-containing protein 28b n=1 Tax=Amblyomma americanum TaxID=6943 RepID=A0AAQ4DV78_AMBAM
MSETSAADETKSLRPKMEFKPTPRRAPRNGKVGGGGPAESDVRGAGAPCEQHSFLTDVTDVRQMEQGLLQLLHDFHSGKLQAFGKDCTFEKMEHVREQQERLARLHFELNAQQELCGPESEEGRQLAKDNLTKLIENLQHLSQSMYPLHCIFCATFSVALSLQKLLRVCLCFAETLCSGTRRVPAPHLQASSCSPTLKGSRPMSDTSWGGVVPPFPAHHAPAELRSAIGHHSRHCLELHMLPESHQR